MDDDEDDECMESNFGQIDREELRSLKIGKYCSDTLKNFMDRFAFDKMVALTNKKLHLMPFQYLMF